MISSQHRLLALIPGLFLLSICSIGPGFAQSSDDLKLLRSDIQALKETQNLRNDVQAVKDTQAAILKELQEIKTLLRQAPAAVGPARAQDIVLSMESGAIKGDNGAKLTLVEFTDYQCPFCSRYYRDTLPEIEKDYVKTGKLKYVVREFPLESIHPLAFKAAEGAQCAGEQKKYWEMHDQMFSDQKTIAAKDLPKHAEALGLNVQQFQSCLDSGKYVKAIRKDLADGQKAGVTGTPSFFLGIAQPNGSVKVVNQFKGAQPYAAFKEAIDSLLASQQ
jgi:protein-disulfide isomerase